MANPDAIHRFRRKLSKIRHSNFMKKKQEWTYGLPEMRKPIQDGPILERRPYRADRNKFKEAKDAPPPVPPPGGGKRRIRRIRPTDGIQLELEIADLNM